MSEQSATAWRAAVSGRRRSLIMLEIAVGLCLAALALVNGVATHCADRI